MTRRSLELTPGPGFTLVVGRNGSGKSSFAEALELLLTGDNLRWRDRSVTWKEGWRNLHHPVARIAADLVVEGSPGATTVTCTWPDGGDLDDRSVAVQPLGRPKTDLASLGWEEPLVAYRRSCPTTSSGRCSTRARPSVRRARGDPRLDRINVDAERLRQARLDRERTVQQVKTDLKALLPALEARARARTDDVPPAVGARVVPGLCRAAGAVRRRAHRADAAGCVRVRRRSVPARAPWGTVTMSIERVGSDRKQLVNTPACAAQRRRVELAPAVCLRDDHFDEDPALGAAPGAGPFGGGLRDEAGLDDEE